MAITVYYVPQDQAALDEALSSPEQKHVWHDVPSNRYVIYTDQDIPQLENSNE